ncbi:TetR family transcriptional regulator [Amnibacterium flavum]|uniref:TetR family transcriptional regulator n=2 Tax=Amnibacterium flavum TaxID=2173173 RepID=A0A2V1HUV8_9MICO|nr:TetR family transcriptional regulator [Amnibacterium flavum]
MLFAIDGYAATSIGHIAEAAGLSKSAVLYHYSSKEALLEAIITPAVDGLEGVVASFARSADADPRHEFVEPFVDYLLANRLEMSIFVNQGQSLRGLPVIDRANGLVQRLGDAVSLGVVRIDDRIRFGMALGGAAYTVVAAINWTDNALPSAELEDADEVRAALVEIVTGLLVASRTSVAAH